MSTVKIKDKTFRTFIPEAEIMKRVKAIADRINKDYEGKNPLLLAVLNGSFIFAADLMRFISIPCEISFVKLASYEGTASTGKIKEMIGIGQPITDRHVIIVEDIVDTGFTMSHMLDSLRPKNPASLQVCTLLAKPGRLKVQVPLTYVAMEIPDDFIVGYGLDYDQQGRNLRDIYTIVD